MQDPSGAQTPAPAECRAGIWTGQRGHSTGHEMLHCPWEQRKASLGITCQVMYCGAQPGWVEIRRSAFQAAEEKI